MYPRITEILPNPPGTDQGKEWVELCADDPTDLASYALQVSSRTLALSGTLPTHGCSTVLTGTATIRNREATVSLLYKGKIIQSVTTAGTAPEGYGFHVGTSSYWATSTPGIPSGPAPGLPPLPELAGTHILPGLLGTAACTAGILTAIAIAAFRHARDRYHARTGGDPGARRGRGRAPGASAS